MTARAAEQSQQQTKSPQSTPLHTGETSEQSSTITISVPGLPPLPPYPPPPHIPQQSHPPIVTMTTPIITTPTHSTPPVVTGLSTQDRIALHLEHSAAPSVQHRKALSSRQHRQPVSGDKERSRTKQRELAPSSHNPAPSTSSLTEEDTIVSTILVENKLLLTSI